jgi:FMN phosphatase YigB (HAD superfamily)
VLSQLDLVAERCMYVGDNPIHDIDPAKAEGFIAVRSKRSGHYSGLDGQAQPDYTVRSFYELRDILQRDFAL